MTSWLRECNEWKKLALTFVAYFTAFKHHKAAFN